MKLDDVIRELLNDTPVSEIPQAVADLKLISPSSISSSLSLALKEYNTEHCVVVQSSQGGIVLSKHNEQDGGWYVDHSRGLKITVDHVKREVLDEEPFEVDELCQSLCGQLEAYVEEKFPHECDVLVTPDVIVIVGGKSSAANFWNCQWRSEYEFDGETLTGEVHLDVHYYEDGNVRLLTTDKVSEQCSDPVAAIAKLEDSIEIQVQRSIMELNDRQFKQLRRQLPITRTKVQWGSAIGTYRLGKDVAK